MRPEGEALSRLLHQELGHRPEGNVAARKVSDGLRDTEGSSGTQVGSVGQDRGAERAGELASGS